jgi:hypothetical protein
MKSISYAVSGAWGPDAVLKFLYSGNVRRAERYVHVNVSSSSLSNGVRLTHF